MKQHNITSGNTQVKEIDGIYFKCEFQNPTGSVKDRSFSYQILKVKELGFTNAVISSSGNAGISAAKYCKDYGINLTVFVSYHIHPGKLKKLKELEIPVIQTHKAISDAQAFASENNAYNLRQSTDPYAVVGLREISYELQFQIPQIEAIFIPVSSGTMFSGIAEGYGGNEKYRMPALHAIQTEAVHPIAGLFDTNYSVALRSIADGIVAKVTAREKDTISLIKKSRGSGWVIGDNEIKKAWEYLMHNEIKTSYEGALSLAGVWKAERNGIRYQKKVVILSGSYYPEETER